MLRVPSPKFTLHYKNKSREDNREFQKIEKKRKTEFQSKGLIQRNRRIVKKEKIQKIGKGRTIEIRKIGLAKMIAVKKKNKRTEDLKIEKLKIKP